MDSLVMLEQARRLPERDMPGRLVQWHVFRDITEAAEYAGHVVLGQGQHLAGGWDSDSVGKLWWIGVEVDDLRQWGNPGAINKHAG
ncbi:MAG: hypothetical protein AB1513_01270 [Pseudomonadota bacterium]